MIFINAESGIKASPIRSFGIDTDQIDIHDAIQFKELEELFWEIHNAATNDENPFIGVALDSVTEIQKKLLESVVSTAVRKANRRGMERDPWTVNREDWGVNTEQMRQLIRKFRDLPCHTGFACLERRDVDESDGSVAYGPAVTPALGSDLMGYVDLLCYCFTELREGSNQELYWGYFRPHGKYQAKDRFRLLPRRMLNPTFDRVIGYVRGEITTKTDPDLQAAKETAHKSGNKEE
jgi:hypothetical protein